MSPAGAAIFVLLSHTSSTKSRYGGNHGSAGTELRELERSEIFTRLPQATAVDAGPMGRNVRGRPRRGGSAEDNGDPPGQVHEGARGPNQGDRQCPAGECCSGAVDP